MFFPTSQEASSSSLSLDLLQPCRRLTFSEIQLATNNFDESLVIGRGGFGKVYRGTITNGETLLDAAVKRLESTSNQGAEEFWAEVEMLSKLRHCHLVSLIGYCNDEHEMILIYEYMPNGTLADRLHKHRAPLTWVRRLKICIGAARGLDYLHTGMGINQGVIHRDVKSSNILLDGNWASKISDFGLSKVGPTNQPSTYVNTLVKGTFGYLDPNYFNTGKLTRKSDVYAFGVILFEVLCGKQAVDRSLDEDQWGLAPWAQDHIKEGNLKQIVDSNLKETISSKCMKKFAQLADRCLNSHPKRRPTMADIVVGLQSILALQEQTNKTLLPMEMKLFGRKLPAFRFASNNETSGSSLKSLELYLNTIGGENQILRGFDFNTISVATENFSPANLLSSDTYSKYKGKLQNRQDIAIIGPYTSIAYELCMNQVSILLKVEHENLVPLLGYCIHGTDVYLLYDCTVYATMDHLIFDHPRAPLDWDTRYRILLAVARVLLYLHKHAPIGAIYCNVKPLNILLDEGLNPKLSGFHFGITTAINQTDYIEMDVIYGYIGYLPPEYAIHGHLSTKTDVFSFGVLVLETLSGRSITSIKYIWKNWLNKRYSNIIDTRIDADSTSITRYIHIGLWCIQDDSSERPTMEEVVALLLGSSSISLPFLKEPFGILRMDFDGSIQRRSEEIYLSDSIMEGGSEETYLSEEIYLSDSIMEGGSEETYLSEEIYLSDSIMEGGSEETYLSEEIYLSDSSMEGR